jgi:TRAP-type C4-dicarboxylate transport system permease small subunit
MRDKVEKVKALIDAFDRVMSVMTRNTLRVAIVMLILLALLVVVEVIVRKLLGFSLQITTQYSAYLSGGIIFLGLASAFRAGSHLRVEMLVSRLGPKARRYADLWAGVLGLICLSFLFKYTLDMVITSYQVGAFSRETMLTIGGHLFQTPMWIPQLVMPLGVGVLILELIIYTVKLSFSFGDSEKGASAS